MILIKNSCAMKKSLIFVSAAAVCLLAACSKNAELDALVPEVINATPTLVCAVAETDPGLKSSVSDAGAFAWSSGDQAALYSGGWQLSSALEATYDGTNSATPYAVLSNEDNAKKRDAAYFIIGDVAVTGDKQGRKHDQDQNADGSQ